MKRPAIVAMALCLGLSLPLANAVARGATADVASGACQAFGTVTTLSQAAPAIVCQATRHRLLIVGDEHGSNEIPDFVAQLVKAANGYKSDVTRECEGQTVNAKSIMGVLMLAAGQGMRVKVRCAGEDGPKCLEEIRQLIANRFGEPQ